MPRLNSTTRKYHLRPRADHLYFKQSPRPAPRFHHGPLPAKMPAGRSLPLLASLPLLLLLLLSTPASSKFSHTFPGIAAEAVAECKRGRPAAAWDSRDGCRAMMTCVMASISNAHATLMGSGSSILGFIPTVLVVLGNSSDELLRIHARFPLLSALLAIGNVNTVNPRVAARTLRRRRAPLKPYAPAALSRRQLGAAVVAHVALAAMAAAVVWQTVVLARNAVVAWACWTSHYPVVWVAIGVAQHGVDVVMARVSGRGEVRGPWTGGALLMALLGNFNYVFGTIVFSSLQLVSGVNALKVMCVYAAAAVVTRLVGGVVLDFVGEWPGEEEEGADAG
ncbi:hypothetical protein EDC01DRAFT_658631 [Geopyxis carbonaria]|nr:hypothetical protein EDC01DRAFT_658631 [Geopyxis carbonaria]